MNFIDSFKMAIHNLWHNKSRSILTITIVFVVSLLIMAMILLGTNFVTNQNTANMLVYEKFGTSYSLNPKNYDAKTEEDRITSAVNTEEVFHIMEKTMPYNDIVDTFYYMPDIFNGIEDENIYIANRIFALTAFEFPLTEAIGKVIEGRIWNASDINTNNIWINSKTVTDATVNGINMGIGDTLKIKLIKHDRYNNSYPGNPSSPDTPKDTIVEYKIAGIYEQSDLENSSYMYSQNFSPNYMTCARYTTSKFPTNVPLEWGELSISYTPTIGAYNFNESEKRMKSYVDEINLLVGKGTDYQGKTFDRFSCGILLDMQMSRIMGLVIMGVVALLAFLILLLSIGSVANTIIISVDKNRKFIGLMKAMGLNNKGVKGMVYKEAFISITLGIAIATLVIFCAKGLILQLLIKMFGGLFGSYGIDAVVTFSFNFLIPIGVLLAFIGMAVLFSKGALNKMGKADPIAIISEVA